VQRHNRWRPRTVGLGEHAACHRLQCHTESATPILNPYPTATDNTVSPRDDRDTMTASPRE
jgi:hypothetical protein